MTDALDRLAEAAGGPKNASAPPLHLWHPELSGDIDIVIRRDGSWMHEGSPIRRHSLVCLFASILRREDDGEYYLVTPVEKWRLQVEALPLVVTDFDVLNPGSAEQVLRITTNTDKHWDVAPEYPLFLCAEEQGIPAVQLDNGLAALFSRAAWYRLADYCDAEERGTEEGFSLLSSGTRYILG